MIDITTDELKQRMDAGEKLNLFDVRETYEFDEFNIGATFFMAYHSVGITSTDFIESLRHANEISANITNMMRIYAKKYTNNTDYINSIEVFPYR